MKTELLLYGIIIIMSLAFITTLILYFMKESTENVYTSGDLTVTVLLCKSNFTNDAIILFLEQVLHFNFFRPKNALPTAPNAKNI